MNEEDEEEENGIGIEDLYLRTPGPGSSVSQSSDTWQQSKQVKTSWIHKFSRLYKQGNISYWGCNHCSASYRISGGTAVLSKHLKLKHGIDPEASSVARKRDQNGTAVYTALLRYAEDTNKKVQQYKQLVNLSKATFEYLYIRWTTTHNIAFSQVEHTEFRDCTRRIPLILGIDTVRWLPWIRRNLLGP